jgi:hypothetical protein
VADPRFLDWVCEIKRCPSDIAVVGREDSCGSQKLMGLIRSWRKFWGVEIVLHTYIYYMLFIFCKTALEGGGGGSKDYSHRVMEGAQLTLE